MYKHRPPQHLNLPRTRNTSIDHVNRPLSISIIGSRQGNSRHLESRKSTRWAGKHPRSPLEENHQIGKSPPRHHHALTHGASQRTTARQVGNGRPKAYISRHRYRRPARGRVQSFMTACNETSRMFHCLQVCIDEYDGCMVAALLMRRALKTQQGQRRSRDDIYTQQAIED